MGNYVIIIIIIISRAEIGKMRLNYAVPEIAWKEEINYVRD